MKIRTTSLIAAPLTLCLAFGCASTNKDAAGGSTAPAAEQARPADQAPPAATSNIVEVAVEAGQFQTLAAALDAANLVETLQGPGPFTVFAPTDEAFAKLPEGALDALLANPEQLEQVLLLHVVSGKVMAADVTGLSEATAMSGGTLPIDTSNGVKVGDATVVKADIEASNGVIHVIDTVLLPKS
ncbi:MAG: fasciclin domain-containing protein [Deltaproteobacteria bacterium]|nr:fasciclin domain-containing protein [Deltaproteobacteria bacterium]